MKTTVSGLTQDRKNNQVALIVKDSKGRIKEIVETNNLRTNAGIDWLADLMGNASGTPANYIAVTANNAAPLATDTTLTGEISTDGLSRALATYSHTSGIASYTLQKVFNVTGGPHTVAKSGLFNAASLGTMAFEALFASSATVNASDTLTVNWQVNL